MRSQREGGLSAITQVKVLSPEITNIALGQGFHYLEASTAVYEKASIPAACRGLRPWQVIELFTPELGRAMSLPEEASNKLKRQGGSMAIWQSD